jgi:DNA (cytosine-5)-methyltransferase 1
MVRAMQAWKKPERTWGRYRAQYVWRCPNVACRNQVVEPGWLPAAAAIDWSLMGERIGDRARPLADKTMQRIRAGLERYARPELLVPVEGRDGKTAASVWDAMRTMTTRNETGLLVPAGGDRTYPNQGAFGVRVYLEVRPRRETTTQHVRAERVRPKRKEIEP